MKSPTTHPSASSGLCSKCNAENEYSKVFCDFCGERLPWAQKAQNQLPTTNEWHYAYKGERLGPVSIAKIEQLVQSGDITRDTAVWKKGLANWCPAHETDINSLFSQSSAPPPMKGDDVSDTAVWVLAFVPLLGIFLGWWLFFVNAALCCWDLRNLKKAGHDDKGMTVWALLLVPVYLFVRASRLKQKNAYAWVWLGIFLLSIGIEDQMKQDAAIAQYQNQSAISQAVLNSPDLVVTQIGPDTSSYLPKLDGKVKNNGQITYRSITITFQFKTASGAILSEGSDSLYSDLAPGQEWQFSIMPPSETRDFDYKGITATPIR